MTMLLGDVDVMRDILDAQLRIGTLEILIEKIVVKSGVAITASEITEAREKAFEGLKRKYPNMGLAWTPQK